MNKKLNTRTIAVTAMLSAVAFLLAFLEFPVPLFESFMPVDRLIASFGEIMPFIKTKADIVLFNALPFNLLKGLVIGVFTMLIYKKLSPVLKGRN